MRHALLLVVLLVFACPVAVAEKEAAELKQIELKGVPAVVTPPDMPGTERTTAPGQWQITYVGGGVFHRMQVRVFPVRDLREPGPVLMQALDTLVRNNGFGAFGATGRRTSEVWGRPVADAAIQVSVKGKVARGRARLLLVTDRQWALAWGVVTAPELTRGTLAEIERFTRSLEPRDPTFYAPRFRNDAELARVVHRADGEPPITNAHLYAIASLIEAGLGRRFPLRTRANIEAMLLLDVQQGSKATRKGYREAGMDVANSMRLDPKARAERMQALGKRILEAIGARAKAGYRPAIGARRIWLDDGKVLGGEGPNALTEGVWQTQVEIATFLLSIARDAPAEVRSGELADHRRAAVTLWMEGQEGRSERRAFWARLRHAWDTAAPAGRRAFRRAVLSALLMPHPDPDVDAAQELGMPKALELRALKQWMRTHRAEYEKAWAFGAAVTMSLAMQQTLADALGVEAEGYQFGW